MHIIIKLSTWYTANGIIKEHSLEAQARSGLLFGRKHPISPLPYRDLLISRIAEDILSNSFDLGIVYAEYSAVSWQGHHPRELCSIGECPSRLRFVHSVYTQRTEDAIVNGLDRLLSSPNFRRRVADNYKERRNRNIPIFNY